MSGQIFISYRRDDSAASAGRLYDRLITHFPSNQIFMDVDSLDPGVDFVEAIQESVSSCDVLIAVIGKRWLISSDEEGRRRLDNSEDFVRLEIATALKRGVRVIPVLVDEASVPRSRELPGCLKSLVRRNALEISHTRFRTDSERLIGAVERILKSSRAEDQRKREDETPEAERHKSQGSKRSETATEKHFFVNTLGMRFVPLPQTNMLFDVWETRVKDYQTFCEATGRSWQKPTFSQTGDHPAVNVSWEDATAFCEWLSRKEEKGYRLPTDHEWSCAVGIGDREDAKATPKSKQMKIANVFPWGEQWPPPNDAGNYRGHECKSPAGLAKLRAAGYDTSNWPAIKRFNDGKVFTTAVGSFGPNALGIYDMGGNVWEWCQDEYEPGSAARVLRGGSWIDDVREDLLSSSRYHLHPNRRYAGVGFRVVVEANAESACAV